MTSPTALPALDDNYIWLLGKAGGRAVIVDPGAAKPVRDALDRGPPPCAILLTHHHHDHIGAAAELARHWRIPVLGPVDERIDADRRVREGDRIDLPEAGLELQVLEVPGHTRSHVAYLADGVLFSGDTLFSLGCGRLFEGTPAQMLASLDRLAALPAQTRVCCGHEYTLVNAAFATCVDPDNAALAARIAEARAQRAAGRPSVPSTIASERASNPFLRCDDPALARRVAERSGSDPNDRIATFAALRHWKDGFVAT